MNKMYQKIKRQNGERFAQTLRNFHSGILEIPDIDKIVRHAGRDAEPLFPYLMTLLTSSNDDTLSPAPASQNPFALLDQAGYNAFYADTLQKQNSITRYFAQGELLCTFNDHARYQDYYIVHAVRKDVEEIKREDFRGKEERQDAYGTSVISIQILKAGGFIKITNRYNHGIDNADNTFKSNPDNIVRGLSAALKHHFNVDFSESQDTLPDGFVLIGNQIFKYHEENSNIYYGDQAWVQYCRIHETHKSEGELLFGNVLFDNKNKVLRKIDPYSDDSFAHDFNWYYGGNPALNTRNGNLYLGDELLIGAERSRIKELYLHALTETSRYCLYHIPTLTHFEAKSLIIMGKDSLSRARALVNFKTPALRVMGDNCLHTVYELENFEAPNLEDIGDGCFSNTRVSTNFLSRGAPRLAIG